MKMRSQPFSQVLRRRQLMKMAAAAGVTVGAGSLWPRSPAYATAEVVAPEDRKLLFVLCAWGGASIIDSYLPVVETEVGDSQLAGTLNVFPEQLVEQRPGSNLRAVKRLDAGDYTFYARPTVELSELIDRHGHDMAVIAHGVSSVNHTVGQSRSLNGAGINRGRTIMEAMALRYGGGMILPSCNMAVDGYAQHGSDDTVPPSARHEIITNPELFASGTHGYKGLPDMPSAGLVSRARLIRGQLDRGSAFAQTFEESPRLRRYLRMRQEGLAQMEEANLIEQLLLLDPNQVDAKYGLQQSPLAAEVRQRFSGLDSDYLQAEMGLGFLMAYYGISTSVTMGLRTSVMLNDSGRVMSAPIAFDYSHNAHRVAQNVMWTRMTENLDSLIALLKTHDYMGDPSLGKMWDRSLIYVATEFGREKIRPQGSDSWGTSHDLNNGSLLISPLLRGNRVYGGVDPKTCLTYGFDPVTGDPDKNRVLTEGDVYSIVAHTLDIDFPGRTAYPVVVR